MAESSLDDFFAKKDKSKKKSKSSKLTPGDILAKSEEPVKKDKKKKDKEKSQSASDKTSGDANLVTVFSKEEEEIWKDVEEEAEKDYSGLRIANLQISEKEGEETEDQDANSEAEEDENGEVKEKKDTGQQGPWKPQSQQATSAPVVQEEQKPAKEEPPKTPGKYVSPGMRAAAAAAAAGPTVPSHLRKKKNAPNLRSEEDFPTLGGGPMPIPTDRITEHGDSRSFERVQFGGKQMEDPSKTTQQLSLGNKFSALQD